MYGTYLLSMHSHFWHWLVALLPPPTGKTLHRLSKRSRHPDLNTTEDHPTLSHARIVFESKNYAESVVLFTQLTRLNNQNAWAWHGLGDSYQLLGSSQAALQAYSKAIALQPNEGLHYGGRANAHQSLGNHNAEAQDWTMALQINPSLAWMRPHSPQGFKD